MRLDTASGFRSFSVTDDATGKAILFVLWVDDTALEYAVIAQPLQFNWDTFQPAEDVIKVTRVAMNYANREIHLNEPPDGDGDGVRGSRAAQVRCLLPGRDLPAHRLLPAVQVRVRGGEEAMP
jgi:hypothetical protein